MRPKIDRQMIVDTMRGAAQMLENYGALDMIHGIAGWYWTRLVVGPKRLPTLVVDAPDATEVVISMALAAHILEDGAEARELTGRLSPANSQSQQGSSE